MPTVQASLPERTAFSYSNSSNRNRNTNSWQRYWQRYTKTSGSGDLSSAAYVS